MTHWLLARAKVLAITAGILMAAVASSPSGASGNQFKVLTLLGANIAGYATPVVVLTQGDQLEYTNYDILGHNVESVDSVPCETDPSGFCPLFTSGPSIGLTKSAPVLGVDILQPGTYGFFCKEHPNMVGRLIVQSVP